MPKNRPFLLRPRHEAHLYCTTLLADAIQREHSAFAPQWQLVDLALFRGEYLFPRAFAEYPQIRWIWPAAADQVGPVHSRPISAASRGKRASGM